MAQWDDDTALSPTISTDYHLQLLDGFMLSADGEVIDLPLQAERVLALLAVHRRPQSRRQLTAVLWPDSPGRRAAANLRSALWHLRNRCGGAVEALQQHAQLAPSVRVDQWQVSDWCDLVRTGETPTMPLRLGPIDVGELLPTWVDDWLVLPRERHRLQWLQALEDYAERCLQSGDCRSALDAALSVIAADPLRESAYYLLVDFFVAQQNRAKAIECYTDLEAVLDRELGVAPVRLLADLLG